MKLKIFGLGRKSAGEVESTEQGENLKIDSAIKRAREKINGTWLEDVNTNRKFYDWRGEKTRTSGLKTVVEGEREDAFSPENNPPFGYPGPKGRFARMPLGAVVEGFEGAERVGDNLIVDIRYQIEKEGKETGVQRVFILNKKQHREQLEVARRLRENWKKG